MVNRKWRYNMHRNFTTRAVGPRNIFAAQLCEFFVPKTLPHITILKLLPKFPHSCESCFTCVSFFTSLQVFFLFCIQDLVRTAQYIQDYPACKAYFPKTFVQLSKCISNITVFSITVKVHKPDATLHTRNQQISNSWSHTFSMFAHCS